LDAAIQATVEWDTPFGRNDSISGEYTAIPVYGPVCDVRRVGPGVPGIFHIQNLTALVDHHIAQAGQPVASEGCDVPRIEVLLDQEGKVRLQEDVGIMDNERSFRKERFGVLERTARAEDGVLRKEGDPF
jgi:hypothetical protein